MPVPKMTLNLDPWIELIPEERNNDVEFNLLVQRFKRFHNEVREFQLLHKNCSVALANIDATNDSMVGSKLDSRSNSKSPKYQGATSINTHSGTSAINGLNIHSHDEQVESSTLDNSSPRQSQKLNGQNVINLRKRFLLNQDSGLPSPQNQKAQQVFGHNSALQHSGHKSSVKEIAGRNSDLNKQHYNSSHNLVSLSLNSSTINHTEPLKQRCTKPEIKQRYQSNSNSHLLMSRSSERLDNTKHIYSPPGLDEVKIPKEYRPVRQDSDNIYDAVSPDMELTQHNINRVFSNNGSKSLVENSPSNIQQETKRSRNLDDAPPLPVHIALDEVAPNSGSFDQERSNNSINSNFDAANNTSSSLSLVTSYQDQEYGNYVNIDFFLKRSHSPSFDLDEQETSNASSDENTTQMSNSYSNSQICDDSIRDLSARDLARKLSSNIEPNNSASSLTPASSGDFLDDSRCPNPPQESSTSSFSKHFHINNQHGSFFSSTVNHDCDFSQSIKCPPHETASFKVSSPQVHKGLSQVQEDHSNLSLKQKQTPSKDHSQIHSESYALNEAQTSMRSFLSDLNLSRDDDVFEDKAQRRIVKESFAVEFCGRRKLRHLFLFNDVIVCAKYQASSKQKFTFDVKWYLNLNGVSVSDVNDANSHTKIDKEAMENQILVIRTNLMLLRARMLQIKRSRLKRPSKVIKKLKKKRTELEAELVLLLPHLPLVIKHLNGKRYLFFLSSNFDRNQWIESIKYLQSQLPAAKTSSSPSSSELQAWIQTCRKNLNPSLGTFLLRSNCDDDLLYGDLFINLTNINGLPKPGHYYFCFEVDSYGHFSQKASSIILRISGTDQDLNEEYVLPLDGAHTLRILLYEDLGQNSKPTVIGKVQVELSRAWFLEKPVEKIVEFNTSCRSSARLSFSDLELLSMRIPHAKLCPTFGLDIAQVCKKEKTTVPMLIQLCVNEVERRGMREVGIYRMSGTSTDIQRLKKAFETNPYVAELLLRDIDINSVTGFLKTYLREMPEGLFINKLYLKFVAAFNIPQTDLLERSRKMLELFNKIPLTNQHTIMYLVEHLVKVNKYESHNKMSLTNLATVLGPNILRPPIDSSTNDSSDPFTAVVIGSMSQAGILYFFLNRKASNLPLTELDRSELEVKVPSSVSLA